MEGDGEKYENGEGERDEQGEGEEARKGMEGEGRREEEEDSWEKDWSSREGVTQEHDLAEENEEQMKTGNAQQQQLQQHQQRQQEEEEKEEEAFAQDYDSKPIPEPSPRKRKRGRPPKASRDNPSATTATATASAATAAAATAAEPNSTRRYSDPFASDPFSSDPDAPEVTDPFAPSPSSSAFPPAPPAPPPGPDCGYAAVTLANLGGVFLKRRQLEGLLADEAFDRKVVGTFVRIRVPGPANQTEACYRLVRVTGCTSQTEMYPVGKGLTNRVLLIMNLKTPEATTIDLVSNSDFTEEECQKLRQYMKWGLVDRLTVDEVAAKESELHELKVND
ncbi:unnamed protein product, partial [Closterium sp. Yama58-4]